MKIVISSFRGLLIFLLFVLVFANTVSGDTQPVDDGSSRTGTNQIAAMPFLVGKLESPDNPVEKPLSRPLSQMLWDRQSVAEGAELTMTRILHRALTRRLPERTVPSGTVSSAYKILWEDTSLDTPRKLAVRLGKEVGASYVVVGTLWRYREKGPSTSTSFSPASIAFALYMIEVSTGNRLWRGSFDGTQKILTEDVLGGIKQFKLGVRWLSAEELAQYGIKQTLRKFPM